MREPATSPGHYNSIQLLRFIAATMVVIMHTTEAMAQRLPAFINLPPWTTGGAGVDIFFVISGFVMAISSRPANADGRINLANAIDFFKRRILRVVPLYWFYTLLKIGSVIALPALALRTTLDPAHLIASFLFLPWASPWGLIQPVLPVGWTLNFEMLFYLVFATAMALNFNRLWFCLTAFVALYAAGMLFPEQSATAFYGHTLLFEFVIGMLIARIHTHRTSLLPALLLVLAGGALLGFKAAALDRIFTQGLGAGMLVLGALYLEQQPRIRTLFGRLSVLGDISYSSYLCHSFLVPLSIALLAYTSITHASVVVTITLMVVVASSFASYFGLERPMTASLKPLLFRPQATRAVATVQPSPTRMGNL